MRIFPLCVPHGADLQQLTRTAPISGRASQTKVHQKQSTAVPKLHLNQRSSYCINIYVFFGLYPQPATSTVNVTRLSQDV